MSRPIRTFTAPKTEPTIGRREVYIAVIIIALSQFNPLGPLLQTTDDVAYGDSWTAVRQIGFSLAFNVIVVGAYNLLMGNSIRVFNLHFILYVIMTIVYFIMSNVESASSVQVMPTYTRVPTLTARLVPILVINVFVLALYFIMEACYNGFLVMTK